MILIGYTMVSEQTGPKQVDHHPRRQHPDPGLGGAGGRSA